MAESEAERGRLRRAADAARERIRAARKAHQDEVDAGVADDLVQEEPTIDADAHVPYGLRVSAAWAWRFLVLAAAGYVALWMVSRLSQVLIPLAIALLLSALLAPAVGFLRTRMRMPASLAAAIVLIGGLLVVLGTLTLVITQFIDGGPALAEKAATGVEEIQRWLRDGPMNLSTTQLDDALAAARAWLEENRQSLTSGALATATAGVEAVASGLLILFVTFFFLRDGRRLWRFTTLILPRPARRRASDAGHAAWLTLVAYVRATVLVAFIDAVGIGLALVLLRVEFAFPLAALVFLASFIPIVGATLSGVVAVLVALVDEGTLTALLVLAAVIVVQQTESHVLQPLIMGRAVSVHPLAVIVAIATGIVVAGIIGALIAVPIVAALNTAVRHLGQQRPQPPPDSVIIRADANP
ncbi:AI-2E family transporter [Rhizocola hellebori]|uniref:AI-2E family transporter n=1 Tax=Rhizocola hellebori TaxID=1392758 RepID=A0A8J3Q587_9ACTN|nr:AI-2E family transporter [Rhizocola hellebori]GIH03591.1 AI-2E family transporter [Rhizocola hellebori]